MKDKAALCRRWTCCCAFSSASLLLLLLLLPLLLTRNSVIKEEENCVTTESGDCSRFVSCSCNNIDSSFCRKEDILLRVVEEGGGSGVRSVVDVNGAVDIASSTRASLPVAMLMV